MEHRLVGKLYGSVQKVDSQHLTKSTSAGWAVLIGLSTCGCCGIQDMTLLALGSRSRGRHPRMQ